MSDKLLYENLGRAYTATANGNRVEFAKWSEEELTDWIDSKTPPPENIPFVEGSPHPDPEATLPPDPEEGIHVKLTKYFAGSQDPDSLTGGCSINIHLFDVSTEGGLSSDAGFDSISFNIEGLPPGATSSATIHNSHTASGKLNVHVGNNKLGTWADDAEMLITDDGIVFRINADNIPRGPLRIRLGNMVIHNAQKERLFEQPDGTFKPGTIGYHNDFWPNVPEINLNI